MNTVLTTIKIKGNDDLHTMLSSVLNNPKLSDSNWFISQFFESRADVDSDCEGTNTTKLYSYVNDPTEVMMLVESNNYFPTALMARFCEIFREIDDNFTISCTYDDSEKTFLGAYYGNSVSNISTEKQLSSLIDMNTVSDTMDLDNAIYYIKEELLEECIEDLTSQTHNNLDLSNDSYNNGGADNYWDDLDDANSDEWDDLQDDCGCGDDTFDDDEDNWDN
jgi:hypothetical protein